MSNDLSPSYLSSLVPSSINNISAYNLRNSNDIQTIFSRTTQYFNSFLPSVISEWNDLPLDIKVSASVNSFKRRLKERTRIVLKF